MDIKKFLGIGVPGGFDDTVVRTVKTFVVAAAALLLKVGLDNADASVVGAVVEAGYVAAGTFFLNEVLRWASK